MTVVALEINGSRHEMDVAPGTTLLSAIRDYLGLKGTKEACGRGECGACTILLDGRPILSCLAMVETTRGCVTTIEGVAAANHDLRQAFADAGAFQCGFCTPGQIVRASALLKAPWPEERERREDFVRRAMAGNICRCTGYTGIVEAIVKTADARGKLSPDLS